MSTILVTGYSKAPQGTSMYEMYKHAGIVLEIEIDTNTIKDASFTFLTNLPSDFLKRLIVGYDISADLSPLVKKIEKYYFAPSQQAVIVALRAAVQRYWN